MEVSDEESMDNLIQELMNALKAKLWYAGLLMTLMLPDVCAALEAEDGLSSRKRYKAWCERWLMKKYVTHLSADDLYYLRCGVAHQAKFDHDGIRYERIFFTLRPDGKFFHKNVLDGALNLDLVWFCKDVVESVQEWFAQKHNDPHVRAHLTNLVQFYPTGLEPYLKGVPAIG